VTAEELMRSRYSAFVVRDAAYLLRTWAAEHRPSTVRFDDRVWTGLEIIGRTGGSAFHTEGTVEFRAHHRTGRVAGEQRENSRFVRAEGDWVYDRPA
jgi:SEC-C motif-containing protein